MDPLNLFPVVEWKQKKKGASASHCLNRATRVNQENIKLRVSTNHPRLLRGNHSGEKEWRDDSFQVAEEFGLKDAVLTHNSIMISRTKLLPECI